MLYFLTKVCFLHCKLTLEFSFQYTTRNGSINWFNVNQSVSLILDYNVKLWLTKILTLAGFHKVEWKSFKERIFSEFCHPLNQHASIFRISILVFCNLLPGVIAHVNIHGYIFCPYLVNTMQSWSKI